MDTSYTKDPQDQAKVIETTTQSVSIDPLFYEARKKDLLAQLKIIQDKLDAIYIQVPDVKPLEDNQKI